MPVTIKKVGRIKWLGKTPLAVKLSMPMAISLGIIKPRPLARKANATKSKLCFGYFLNKTKTLADGVAGRAGFDMGNARSYVGDYTKKIDIMIGKIGLNFSHVVLV